MATVLDVLSQLEQNTSTIILLNHTRTLNHPSTTSTSDYAEVHPKEGTLDESNLKVYVYDNKVRLEQVVKQCTGLYPLTHFCIYYYFVLI